MAIKVSGTEVISDDKRILNNEDLPDIRPSLLLDFANSKTLDPRITFTRGSTATYWDGKTTAKAEENLHQQSQSFSTSPWTSVRVTLTGSQTAPDGTSTAFLLEQQTGETVGGNVRDLNIVLVSGQQYTLSIFAKAGDKDFLYVNNTYVSDGQAWFDLASGTVGTTNSGVDSADIVAVGNGWYRCSFQFTVTTTSGTIFYGPADTDDAVVVTDSGGIYLWGAQLEQRSSATAYTATTTSPIVKYQPVLQTAASGEARFDHDPVTGESKGLLIEEARTNYYLTSNQLPSVVGGSALNSYGIAPDGSQTADLLMEDTGTSFHQVVSSYVDPAVDETWTFSVFVKRGNGSRHFSLRLRDTTGSKPSDTNNAIVYFDLDTGTVGGEADFGDVTLVSSSIEDAGNGWYRCSISGYVSNLVASYQVNYFMSTSGTGGESYTGDGFSSLLLWGFQAEEGSFPTSYIPTSGSTVTRAGDFPLMSGSNFTSWFNDMPFSAYVEYDLQTSAINQRIFSIDTNGYDPRLVAIGSVSSGYGPMVELYDDGNFYANLNSDATTPTETGTHKLAFAFADNDAANSKDGAAVATDTSFVFPSNFSQIRIGSQGTGINHMQGHIKKLAFYPKRLPNATLQAMTEA